MKREDLIRKKNVVLIVDGKKEIAGTSTGRNAIRIGVTKKVPLSHLKRKDQIPRKVDGQETDVFETGEIRALRTTKHRPAPGGVSIGHPLITAGTLGMVIRDKHEYPYILSNNHVLANCNDAQVGDQSWQPGKHDGGGPGDTVGHLFKFAPIHFEDDGSACPIAAIIVFILDLLFKFFGRRTRFVPKAYQTNTVDCAISKPIELDDISDEILGIGNPQGFAEVAEGDKVKKSGRTTEVTTGVVQNVNGIVRVDYGGGRMAVFTNQLLITGEGMSAPGDSGSIILNEDNKVVGLLYAGSDTLTIANKISDVISALGIEV